MKPRKGPQPVELECPYCHKIGTSKLNIYYDEHGMHRQFICWRSLGGCGATRTEDEPKKRFEPERWAETTKEQNAIKKAKCEVISRFRGRKIDAGLAPKPRKIYITPEELYKGL